MHSLIHLSKEADCHGPLDNISAFPYENFLGSLKKLIRKPQNPLEQVIRRLSENTQNAAQIKNVEWPQLKKQHYGGPIPEGFEHYLQYQELYTKDFMLSTDIANSCFHVNGQIALVLNILQHGDMIFIVFRTYSDLNNFFTHPIDSSAIGICKVKGLSEMVQVTNLSDVSGKCVKLPYRDTNLVLPLCHI